MANIKRMRKNLAAIRKYPEQHKQFAWITDGMYCDVSLKALKADNGDHPPCGTTLCFAGWDAFLHAPKGSCISVGEFLVTGDDTVHISYSAEKGMDLTEGQAAALFYRAKNVEDLEVLTDAIAAHPEYDFIDLCKVARDAAKERGDSSSLDEFEMAIRYYDDDYEEQARANAWI